ncbi:retrotransposon protein, putative, ty1-copia subclass, partial [Tanacetum coccineum]
MTRKLFLHRTERATDLLGLIHTDVYGPYRHVSRQGARYFITFTDDYSRYGYVYLLKHINEVIEAFKDYALESATCILNMVPTKKVDKTPYQLWVVELEEVQDEDTSPFENTSEFPMEVEGFEPPQEEVVPVRRSARTHHAPGCFCLNVEVEEHSLRNFNEPANYKAAILDPEYDKRLDAMNVEMQSMKDNQVWCLVDIPPNCKTVGSKWIFKKKTD